jgi:hypothetical protein
MNAQPTTRPVTTARPTRRAAKPTDHRRPHALRTAWLELGGALASPTGPDAVLALARAVPTLEAAELARLITSAGTPHQPSQAVQDIRTDRADRSSQPVLRDQSETSREAA